MRNKIHKLEECLVYSDSENPWVKIYFDKVNFPDGKTGRYNRIVEKDGLPGVAILPILNRDICLVKQYRYPIQKFSWEIPRGFGDSRNSLSEAMRELYEETGILFKSDENSCDLSVVELGIVHPNSGLLASEVKLFAAVCSNEQLETSPQDIEVIEKQWFSLESVLQKIKTSEITDSFTMAAIFKAQLLNLL